MKLLINNTATMIQDTTVFWTFLEITCVSLTLKSSEFLEEVASSSESSTTSLGIRSGTNAFQSGGPTGGVLKLGFWLVCGRIGSDR